MTVLRSLACTVLVLLGCNAMAGDNEYYTQRNLWVYRGTCPTLNYAVDALVPVNSKVTLDRQAGKKLELTLVDSGTHFTVVLQKKYTHESMDQIKDRMLGKQPVDLQKFSKIGQQAIKTGQVVPGMTRDEVLVARGYPPDHATLTLDSNQWKYWQTRWNTILVQFENGKVKSIVD